VLLRECTVLEPGAVWKLVWKDGGQGRVEAMVRDIEAMVRDIEAMVRDIEAGAQISGVAR